MSKENPVACGFLIICETPSRSFLLMKHPDRWDLPKGHLEDGETELECAFRELEEETGITSELVEVNDGFQYELNYPVDLSRYGGSGRVLKRVVLFLGTVKRIPEVQTTEHGGFHWFPWNPPHQIQEQTIDPLLQAAANYLTERKENSRDDGGGTV